MKTVMQSRRDAEKRNAIVIFAVVALVVIAIITFFIMENTGANCPKCDQHFFLIDNSDPLTGPEREKLGISNTSDQPRGAFGIAWSKMAIGSEMAILSFNTESLDLEELGSFERIQSVDETSWLTSSEKRVAMEVRRSLRTIQKTADDAMADESLAQSRIMESLNLLASRIRAHSQIHGSNGERFKYRVSIFSDFLQNSPAFSFYGGRAKNHQQWIETNAAGPGVMKLPSSLDVVIDACLIPRGNGIQNQAFQEFWRDYFAASGAVFSFRAC
jgi:hypothetical protein